MRAFFELLGLILIVILLMFLFLGDPDIFDLLVENAKTILQNK